MWSDACVCATTGLHEEKQTNDPWAGALQKHAYSWTLGKLICRDRKTVDKNLSNLPPTHLFSRSLRHIRTHTIDPTTCLHSDSCNDLAYFAHVSGVVWEFVSIVAQGHSVAMGLQPLHVAFVFELPLCRWTGHIGVNEGLFGPRGPGELLAVDLDGLGFRSVYSQVLVICNTQIGSHFAGISNTGAKQRRAHENHRRDKSICRDIFNLLSPPSIPYTEIWEWWKSTHSTS